MFHFFFSFYSNKRKMAILTNFDIQDVLERNGTPPVYIGYKDKLREKPLQVGAYVVNTAESDDGTGGVHWTAFLIERIDGVHHVVYFDPLGHPPPAEVRNYVRKIDENVWWNSEQLQNENTSICGWYVLYWIWFMMMKRKQTPSIYTRYRNFLSMFSKEVEKNRALLQEYLKPMV